MKSLPRNAALSVTGALLFTGSRFVQFLEGPVDGVATIRRSVLADARHQNIVTFLHDERTERIFRNWSLAYAGPAVFVADRVDALFNAGGGDIAEIMGLLEQFVIAEANNL